MPAIIARMPALNHATLVPRFLDGASSSEGLSGTAIALIICVGVIPLCVVIWVVIWALFFYGRDRTCCCTRRRKAQPPSSLPQRFPSSSSTVVTNEKRWSDSTITMPQRPHNAARIASRNSTQSTGSTLSKRSDIEQVAVQEPKPFV